MNDEGCSIDEYEKCMMEFFAREELKHLLMKYLWEHFKVPKDSDVWYSQFWNGELNKMTDSLIANNGNLTLGTCTYDWDNFVILELAEVYRKWKK